MATTKRIDVGAKRRWRRLGMVVLVLVGGLAWAWYRLAPSTISRGISAYNQGDWSAAYQRAQERLELVKHDPEALRLLARSAARLGLYPDALAIYSGLDVGILEAEDYYLLAMGRSRAGQAVDGRRILNLALASDPDHEDALDLLARLSLQTGHVSEATRAAERLASKPGREARGDLLLGVIHATDQNPADAVEALRRALRRDPNIRIEPSDPSSTLKLLARNLLQLGRSSEARNTLRLTGDEGPDREASWLLSRAYLQAGNGSEAALALARSGSYRAEHPLDPEPAPYVGEARCAGCHSGAHDLVLASRHSRTLRRGRDLTDLPLFDHPLPDPGNPQVSHTLKRENDQVRAETRVQSQVLRAVVAYALGSGDRYTSLVGSDDQGDSVPCDSRIIEGMKGGDGTSRRRRRRSRIGLRTILGEPFESEAESHQCLICHTTNPRSFRDQTGPESQDRGIGCERCHGPGGLHLAAVAAKFSESAIASPANATPAEINQLCGECHSQHFLAMPAMRTAPDWTRFPGSTLPWSRCYAESGGALSCVTCHDPHRNAQTTPAYYEAKCHSCHPSAGRVTESKVTQVAPRSMNVTIRSPCPINPNRNCLDCHMPKVRYDWLHGTFTDHYIRVHPTAESETQGLPARGSTIGANPSRSNQR